MPLYMDIHELGDVTAEDVAKAHVADLEAQEKYGVNYLKYWVNENCGKVFCLVEAPNAEAAHSCHREAHGLVARKIIEIQPELADGFLGDVQTNPAGAALLPGGGADARDPGIRTVLFTDMVESTTFTQSLGDEAAIALLGVHDTIVRDALSALGGREVKHTGDGIMASFVSTAGAVRCAIQIQGELDRFYLQLIADFSGRILVRCNVTHCLIPGVLSALQRHHQYQRLPELWANRTGPGVIHPVFPVPCL